MSNPNTFGVEWKEIHERQSKVNIDGELLLVKHNVLTNTYSAIYICGEDEEVVNYEFEDLSEIDLQEIIKKGLGYFKLHANRWVC